MPNYLPPRTDEERLAFLRQTAMQGAQDHYDDTYYISTETLEDVQNFLPQFDEAFLDVVAALGDRLREVEESHEALDQLKMYLNDLWEMLRRRVRRNNEPIGILRFYYLNTQGHPPVPETTAEWLSLAADVIAGDPQAVEAGYPAAVNPSVAEIAPILEVARKEAADVDTADVVFDRAQTAVSSMRAQADALIAEVMEELRFHLRKEDPAASRHVMRLYGAHFGYRPGEVRDLEDVIQEDDVPVIQAS